MVSGDSNLLKILLISLGRLPWYCRGAPLHFFYTPRAGLPSLAAVTPPEHDVSILDGVGLEDIDFDEHVDLVGVSVLTPFAHDSYQAAARFRERGVTVVMGGVHPSLLPEEAAAHADAIVVGEGEGAWCDLLADASAGKLKKVYRSGCPVDLSTLPTPRFDLIRNREASVVSGPQFVRGCPYGRSCRFCTVPCVFGSEYRVMPIERVEQVVRGCRERDPDAGLNLTACCALNHTAYIQRFAETVRPLGVRWSGAGLLHRLNDARLLDLLAVAGCECVYTESGAPSERNDTDRYAIYLEAAKKIQARGMAISYNFTVGFDEDTSFVYEEVESFIEETGLQRELCAVQIFAPWPGTDEAIRLEAEGRTLDRNWSHYDNTHVVFRPKHMTVEELARRAG